jgi:hypothetical protein
MLPCQNGILVMDLTGTGAMQMNHALRLAADLSARPDDILAAAERLSRQGGGLPLASLASPRMARQPHGGLDNLSTLRACQALLTRTVALLE